jgi:hypothetical protein
MWPFSKNGTPSPPPSPTSAANPPAKVPLLQRQRLSSADQTDLAIANAAESLVSKQSKIQLANEAVMIRDLQELATADRSRAQRLADKYMPPATNGTTSGTKTAAAQGADVPGNIIICDDYDASQITPAPAAPPPASSNTTPWTVATLTAALAGLGLGSAYVAMNKAPATTPPAAVAPANPTTPAPLTSPPATSVTTKPAGPQQWWQITEVQQADGSWKETGRVKLQANPDGSVQQVPEAQTATTPPPSAAPTPLVK